jgi:hypothetical protein
MNRFLKTVPGLLTALAAALFATCSGPDTLTSGGGTETVIGSVINHDGSVASRSMVVLVPAGYNPLAGGLRFSAVTDAGGGFAIPGVPKGVYTALATSADRTKKALVLDIAVNDREVRLPPAALEQLAAARIVFASVNQQGYVFVPGTDLRKKVDSTASIVFDSLPSGTIPAVSFCLSSNPSSSSILRDSVRTEPGDTTLVANTGWRRAKQVVINTTPSGAGISNDVCRFPLALRLENPAIDLSAARADGADFRVTKSDGTPLPFEIEQWNPSGTTVVWVRLDTVRANSAAQSFFIYWGNPSAAAQSKGSAVFDTLNGFVGAWHLSEGGNGSRKNSSQARYEAVPTNVTGAVQGGAGIVGGSDSLNGIDQFYTLGPGMSDWTKGITFSAWAAPSAIVQCAAFMDFGSGAPGDNILFTRLDKSDKVCVQIYNDTANGGKRAGPPLVLNEWQHFAFSVAGSRVNFYKNGLLTGTDSSAQAIRNVIRTKNYFGKNNWAVPGDSYFAGRLDEIELSSVERSGAWIKLSYETQRPGSSAVTIK